MQPPLTAIRTQAPLLPHSYPTAVAIVSRFALWRQEHHQSSNRCFHQFFKYLDDARGLGPRAAPETLVAARAWSAVDMGAVERVQRGGAGRATLPAGDDDDGAQCASAPTLAEMIAGRKAPR